VGLPGDVLERWPHELSGGERARVALARALSADARLLVLDEAFAMLDAVLQAELAALLEELAAARDLGWLLVTHDLALARRLATRTFVLHAGEIVEEGPSAELFARPRHPYTRALVASQTLLTNATRV
jgi:ABC-type dipeptide/oligopeptide/nickel transport system ATPase subunit